MGTATDHMTLLRFVEPILGFDETEFELQDHATPGWKILVSADSEYPSFLLAEAAAFYPLFELELPDAIRSALGNPDVDDLSVLLIANTNSGRGITVNLAAPVVLNAANMTAAQVIQTGDLPTAAPLPGGS